MKRRRILLISILVFLSACVLLLTVFIVSSPTVLISYAINSLQDTFPESVVSIKKCRFIPKKSIVMENISVKRQDAYEITIAEVSINYTLPGLFRKSIDSVQVSGAELNVRSRKSRASELKDMVKISAGGVFNVNEVDISDLKLKIAARDMEISGNVSLKYYPLDAAVEDIDILLSKIKVKDTVLKDLEIKGSPFQGMSAEFSVNSLSYNKAVIRNIKGRARVEGNTLSADISDADIFNGDMRGLVRISLDKDMVFFTEIGFFSLDLGSFVKDFEMQEKFQLTGNVYGSMSLTGKAKGVDDLTGNFETGTGGGSLIITDPDFLEKISRETGQSFNTTVESVMNYKYNVGTVKISLNGGNIVFGIEMEGDSGNRSFHIEVHDIVPIKKGAL